MGGRVPPRLPYNLSAAYNFPQFCVPIGAHTVVYFPGAWPKICNGGSCFGSLGVGGVEPQQPEVAQKNLPEVIFFTYILYRKISGGGRIEIFLEK